MIEAMACGTPVIAFREGSVPEIIDDGVSGYIVNNTREAIEAVHAIDRLSRMAVRRKFEKRFTASRMASDYLNLYTAVIENNRRNLKLKPLGTRLPLEADKAKAV
jgi:glycosyltransferase involved in cell wall biosynthesis